MDCITFNNKLDDYLNGSLDDAELNEFMDHLAACSKCEEELEVSFIVHEGLKRLDNESPDLNLTQAFSEKKHIDADYLYVRKIHMVVAYIVQSAAFWFIAAAAAVFIRLRFFT